MINWTGKATQVVELTNDDEYFENIVEYEEEVNDDSGFSILWRYAIMRWRYGDPRIRWEWTSPVQLRFKEEEE